MSSLPNPQRPTQRRSPAADVLNPPTSSSVNATSTQVMSGSRSSSGSTTRSAAYKRPSVSDKFTVTANQQLSQIEKSVTHLLVATKQLLETLTQWSRHTATEGEVSDVYVRLGYEFNIACRAFNSIGVETTDLGPVPELLRAILEETLSQEASPASLDRFLPRIRDIIISLLHGLKRKQSRLRAKQSKESGSSSSAVQSAASSSSLNQMLEDDQARRHPRGSERRAGSGGSTLMGDILAGESEQSSRDETGPPPRYTSAYAARQDSNRAMPEDMARSRHRESQRPLPPSISDSSMSSNQSSDIAAEQPRMDAMGSASQRSANQREDGTYPPPPPPKQQDALAALQRGGDLERRASRRYSAYQISKHLGASPNGVPMLPPAQHSPIPNRGRDVRESMHAVRVRGSGMLSRQRSTRTGEPSPVRNNTVAQRISEESSQSSDATSTQRLHDQQADDSPIAKTPEDKLRQPDVRLDGEYPTLAATLTGPAAAGAPEPGMYDSPNTPDAEPSKAVIEGATDRRSPSSAANYPQHTVTSSPSQSEQFIPEDSPQPGKELTLFLQYKSKIKKFVLPGGSTDLSVARLQLAFIEKFAWNMHSNGNDLPEIYIQDPISGVRHELEDLRDVKDRSVLVLNIEALDEVKRHIDEGLGGLRRMVEGVRTVVDSQQAAIQKVSDGQQTTSKEVTRLTSTPSPAASRVTSFEKAKVNGIRLRSSGLSKDASSQMMAVQAMKRDLANMRRSFSSMVSDMNTSIADVNSKAARVKTIAIEGVLPSVDSSTGRGYVNSGKKTLGEDSEKLVDRVDNLQDVVEDLRKDVVSRGVRPLPRQLETVGKNISAVTSELKKMQEYLKREKPIWTKIWEKELQLVCSDRDLLTMQEELAADLEDDLEKAAQTFALVEQATKQQNLQAGPTGATSLRSTSKGLTAIATDQEIDPMKAKDGVLGEVRALQPNHETRLEAIERAERARQEELESRREGAFKKELGAFVEEGKLKKSVGVQEAERVRKEKDERNRLEAWGVQQERAAGRVREEESQAAADEGSGAKDENGDQEGEFSEAPEEPRESEDMNDGEEGVLDCQVSVVRRANMAAASSSKRRTSWLPAIFTG
ncbi:MAG: hypothetical protein LQ345_004709 [Seirophora villosa]|nr:MAG: hypothetical protein LQ345_004709 [Seirophora villosa]